jgi:murein DD-endopeptidase MepM/ murein hydrolase activator NlpD
MKKNLIKYLLISLMLIGIVGFVETPAFCAQSKATLDQRLKQTNNKRHYFQEKKKQADLKLKTERNKLSNNQQRLEKAQKELNTTTVRYTSLKSDLSSMEQRLSNAVVEFQNTDIQMKSRIRQVYKHQRSGMFELILSTTNVNTLMDIFYFEKIVIKEDYKRMQALKAKAEEIARLKAQVEAQKRMVEASIRDINSQKSAIQGSIAANKNMIERLKKDKNYYERSERELARQSASIQSMIENLTRRNAQSGGSRVVVSSTGFIKPIAGPITSPFGWRTHPIFKSRIFHSGIDIGGPNGGAIKASNDGKVIYAGWYGGYGKVVILDHGIINGQPVTTLYGHMSAINVSNGQMVKKGQTVGREGSTGYSTGPHCHFEVRVNGKPTSPLNYI